MARVVAVAAPVEVAAGPAVVAQAEAVAPVVAEPVVVA